MFESLLATAILVLVVSLFVEAINQQEKAIAQMRRRQEVLVAALMALQTGEGHLAINGYEIEVTRKEKEMSINANKQEIFKINEK
ncbi:competence type IV pilus minor pilin ComGE [Streptococcus penaeicida]|uniref:competence type IV pilus minor pilin ComGE n=1 Tax=Streptococcus penaeicida TaxID=1765960 RepID=UPI0013FE4DF4|nr:competence type IV pilus minor pilin ComGE [Streptococcus penaeicida]